MDNDTLMDYLANGTMDNDTLMDYLANGTMENDTLLDFFKLDETIKAVSSYLSILIVVFGTVGNGLTLLMMTSRQCRKSSFTVYITALAVVDIIVLWVWPFSYWLFDTFEIDIEGSHSAICKLSTLMTYWGQQVASWLVVALTVERFYCTHFPIQTRFYCHQKTGMKVVSALITVLLLINSHILYGFTTIEAYGNDSVCGIESGVYEKFFTSYFSLIEIVLLFLIPGVVIVICNVATVVKVSRIGQQLNSAVSEEIRGKVKQATIVTFIVSTTFIFLVGPLGIYVVIWPFAFSESADLYRDQFGSKEDMIVFAVVSTMAQIHHSVNFILYVASGTRFRQDLKMVLCGSRVHMQQRPISHSNEANCTKIIK